MVGKTERGQVIVEMIVVSALIGAMFIFIIDRGVLARSELAKTRFQSVEQPKLQMQNFKYLDNGTNRESNPHRKFK